MRRFLQILLFAIPAVGLAQVIPDRTTLNSIVGASGKTVDFETFSIGSGGATSAGVAVLDFNTIASGQGPNLVLAGVTFSVPAGNIQWDGINYYSSPSREILGNASNSTLTITFTNPTKAFGLDLRAFNGLGATASATVYGSDNTTVLSTIPGINLPSSGAPVFFGYQSASGIGKVVLTQNNYGWSPIIDNLTFVPIPEPSVAQLLTGGLALLVLIRRRRHRA